MPRYFFHCLCGDERLADADGTELRDGGAFYDVALRIARFEMSQELLTGSLTLGQRLEVEDECGNIVLDLPFSEAFQNVPPPRHVLVVHADALVSLMIEDALRAMGYTSFEYAGTASEAAAAAVRRCPDLIVAAVELVDGCGIEMVRRICSVKAIPTLLIAEYSVEAARRAPDIPLVRMPFSLADLNRGVLKALAA